MNKKKKEYIRDGRAPVPKKEATSRVMSANKGKETGPETTLQKGLWGVGVRGYRKNWKKAPGRPDIAFPRKKIAIFVNGCYWHRCSVCKFPLPKTNKEFWKTKFARNKKRDIKKIKDLEHAGWSVLTIWEHEIKKDPEKAVKRIKGFLKEHR